MLTIVRRQSKISTQALDSQLPMWIQDLYAKRGVAHPHELDKQLEHLEPFTKMHGVLDGARRLADALMQQEKIVIIGDFDSDGATSTALAMSALTALGAQNVDYLVPNRFEYGYGLTPEIVAVAAKHMQPKVIITVDNGIASIEGAEVCAALGIDLVITDHHLAGDSLPKAVAIINPNQPGCPFPSKHLAGVGVIFYLMLALRSELKQRDWFVDKPLPNMGQLLDLVALGTVADVVQLDSHNRRLVHHGIARIRAGQCRPGITALLQVANREPSDIVAADLGFAVAPRLNAAGRLDDMRLGIECLLAPTLQEALVHAKALDALNTERRAIEATMQAQAMEALKSLNTAKQRDDALGLCLFDPSWHQGVIGIVASRIKDKWHRPVIAFAKADAGLLKGSARSITGVHIRDVLAYMANREPTLISRFGGHAQAAGLTIQEADLPRFREAFVVALSVVMTTEDLKPVLYTDGALAPEQLNLETATQLRYLEPWGQAFPEPVFDGEFVIYDQRLVGGKHLKLTLSTPDSPVLINAIAFNVDLDKWPNHHSRKMHAVYRLDVNSFRGRRDLQLIIEYCYPL